MKNLTFVIGCLSSGGAEHQLSILCNLLADEYNITIVTWVDFDDHYTLDKRIKRIRISPHGNRYIKTLKVMWHILFCKSDAVISYSNKAGIYVLFPLLFRRNIKAIASERNYKDKEGTLTEFLLYRFLYHRADYIVPNSFAQGKYIAENTKFGDKVKPITNYTDVSQYLSSPMRENRPIRIGIFGRYAQQKNYIRLAQAVDIARRKTSIPFEVDWYGKKHVFNEVSKNYREFQSKIEELSLTGIIHLHDHISNVAERMKEFDAICLMSIREGFSNVISEAICSARPVLASDVSDNSIMVHDGVNGFLVDPNDIDSMAEGIIKFLNLPFERKQEMGKESRRIAEQLFNADDFRNKYIALIEN